MYLRNIKIKIGCTKLTETLITTKQNRLNIPVLLLFFFKITLRKQDFDLDAYSVKLSLSLTKKKTLIILANTTDKGNIVLQRRSDL